MDGPRYRVLIVDNHPVVREGLRSILDHTPDLVLSGEASNRDDALACCRKLCPALVVLGLALGSEDGMAVLGELRTQQPSIPVLVFSTYDERFFAERTLRGGAAGYVGKHESSAVLLMAIRRVLAGKCYVSEQISDAMLASLGHQPGTDRKLGVDRLTAREMEVFRLIGLGKKSGQIARLLGIGVKTVETHRGRMREKLSLGSANEVVVFAANWLRDSGEMTRVS